MNSVYKKILKNDVTSEDFKKCVSRSLKFSVCVSITTKLIFNN